MTRNTAKALRLRELEQLLKLRPRRVVELAGHFGVSRRTIERDLEDLRTIADVEEDGATYSIPEMLPPLNEVEALAVHSATRMLVHHTQINERHYRTALEKLSRQLPEVARESVDRSVKHLAGQSTKNSRLLDQVAQAWFTGRTLKFDYLSLGSSTGRAHPQELQIYFFEISRTNLAAYVIGLETNFHNAVRIFKLDRMRNLRLTDTGYSIPEDFDPHDYLSTAWGIIVGEPVEVTLRFNPAVAKQLEELPLQKTSIKGTDADGFVTVTARGSAAKDGLPHDLLAWIHGWGPMVEVLAPGAVRQHMRKKLQETLGLYG